MGDIQGRANRQNLASTRGPSIKRKNLWGTPFLVFLSFGAHSLAAQEELPAIDPVPGQMLKGCEAPPRDTFNRARCVAPGLRAGSWNLQPLSSITAVASVNGLTTYLTEPLPVPSVAAELDLRDCVGPAKLVVEASGQETEIRPNAELAATENLYAAYQGTGVMRIGGGVNMKTEVEVSVLDSDTAIMFFELSNPPVGVGHGNITFEMLYAGPSENEIHPYCDCRTQLRAFLDDRIKLYESLLAMYQDQSLWYKPAGLDPNIIYDYETYNQFAIMVHRRGLTPDQVSGCFNAQKDLRPYDEIAGFFKQPGRAAASTSPQTCEVVHNNDAARSCYPEIDLENYQRHEGVHQAECLSTPGAPSSPGASDQSDNFVWLERVENLQSIPDRYRENRMRAYLDPEIQALAETEIRAYQETLKVYRGWEAANCGSE